MEKVLVNESHLSGIGNAIRSKTGGSTTYKPSEMAAAIRNIDEGYPEPTGTINIIQNGTANVKDYASASVNVPNSYGSSDEGKVVSSGALVSQTSTTITQNGTVDTTLNNEVVVNVAGGGSSDWSFVDSVVLDQYSPYSITLSGNAPLDITEYSQGIQTFYNSYAQTKPTTVSVNHSLVNADRSKSLSALVAENSALSMEYYGYVYDRSSIITDLGLVLLGDFSQGGASADNKLSDTIDNYSAVVLQGIYQKSRISGYNTTMMYADPKLNTQYWAGMKDRNLNYTCHVTFTDLDTVSLTGNKQVIIYGIL